MSTYKFSNSSKKKLTECDDALVQVMTLALTLSKYDFGIGETLRSIKAQQENVASGASLTMESRHLPNAFGESEAADIKIYVNGIITWEPKYFRKVAGAVFKAAFILGIEIEWGGHWESLNDMPHFQLARKG